MQASLNRLTADVHFLTAPLRLIWRSILWLVFLFCAPAIFFSFLLFAIFYRVPDKSDAIWFLKWVFGVIAPFASSFWFLLAVMLPRFYRAQRDGYEVLKHVWASLTSDRRDSIRFRHHRCRNALRNPCFV